MLWEECLERVQSLRPKAARLAARMLRNDPLVPSNWIFSLDQALTFRSKGAGPFTQADLQASQEENRTAAPTFDQEQREAWDFVESIRDLAANGKDGKNEQSPTQEPPEEAIWDPRTPTPEERWLLAFSEELRRLAHDLTDAEDVAQLAIEKLTTDGHRNPVAVAREEFTAGRANRFEGAK